MNAIVEHLKALIETDGPMSVAEFFKIAISGRADSYYNNRVPIGAEGDFITAPEISQAFGECIGGWCIDLWEKLGEPSRLNLIELGPGRGTLMSDVLRVGQLRPGFLAAARVRLVELSPTLRRVQGERLSGARVQEVTWHSLVDEIQADAPAIILANEFFDALPVHQYVRTGHHWFERVVSVTSTGAFEFGIRGDVDCASMIPPRLRNAPEGSVFERGAYGEHVAGVIGRLVRSAGGAALVIDYGHIASATGDTLQALKGHQFADALRDVGDADLTYHVDFEQLGRACGGDGVKAWNVLTQATFLRRLGIVERTEALKRRANEGQLQQLDRALHRLIGLDEMGSLFKVLCASSPTTLSPAGY